MLELVGHGSFDDNVTIDTRLLAQYPELVVRGEHGANRERYTLRLALRTINGHPWETAHVEYCGGMRSDAARFEWELIVTGSCRISLYRLMLREEERVGDIVSYHVINAQGALNHRFPGRPYDIEHRRNDHFRLQLRAGGGVWRTIADADIAHINALSEAHIVRFA